ncbi:MAG: 2TM domain-containing protein [Kofleriaceae bacterium]
MQLRPSEAPMENDEELAKRRVQARLGFIIHIGMYAVAMTALATIWYATGHGYPWFLWPMFGWGIGVVAHALALAFGPGSASERRAIDRELRRMRELPH